MAMAFCGMFSLNLDVGPFDVNVPRVARLFVVSSLDVISRIFAKQISAQIYLISVSGHCVRLIFKICQTVAVRKAMRKLQEQPCRNCVVSKLILKKNSLNSKKASRQLLIR